MKNFNKTIITLFDSTNAALRVAVECQPSRSTYNQATSQYEQSDLVYVTKTGVAMLNPNIYITFTYKSDDAKALYTSYPQLFKIRKSFEIMKNYLVDNAGFIETNGQLVVKSDCSSPVIIDSIGKSNNWISLSLVTLKEQEGVSKILPGVSLQLSTTPNNYTSVLTAEEFFTLYTILKDINLTDIQTMVSLAYLDTMRTAQGQYPSYQQNQYAAPQQYNTYSAPPMAPMPQQQYTPQPKYNRQPYRAPMPPRQAPTPAADMSSFETMGSPNYGAPTTYTPEAKSQNIPPRSSDSQIMTMKAIDETPVTETFYDDSDAIDAIFND